MIFKPGEETILNKLGGKAYHLAKLREAEFLVPSFIVLTLDFFYNFLGEAAPRLRELLSSYDEKKRGEILELIGARDFSEELKLKVLSETRPVFGPEPRLAVRSSAIDEDGDIYSFAGMMESFLSVEGEEELFTAIKNCYLSCFSERAMAYREKHGLIQPELGMAVILQEMVDADVSGVMFTTNPKTNNPDELLISLVQGLGEGLVSGAKDSVDVLYDVFGNKLEGPKEAPLSDEVLAEIFALGLKIESLDEKRRARDIEFSVKDGQIYLLQDRLITTYGHIQKNRERTILDNSNIIESYSGVTTPLTFSFARDVYEKIYRQTLANFYIKQEAIDGIAYDLENMIVFYENKIYYRLNGWYKMTALYPGYNKNKRYMEEMMGVKVELRESGGGAKLRLIRIYGNFFRKLLGMKKATERFTKKFHQVTKDYRNENFSGLDNFSLLGIYRKLEEAILNDFTTPIINDMGAMVLLGKVNDVVRKARIEDGEGLLGKIISKQGNVESVKQSLALMELVNEIWENKELASDFRSKPKEELRSYLEGESLFSSHLRDYIARYGARVMEELKLETLTLKENPDFLFQTLKNYLLMEERPAVYKPLEIDEEALYRQISFSKRWILKRLVKITKYFVRNREFLRLFRTYIYDIVRNIFLRMGYNLQGEGLLASERDVFYMTKEEVFELAEGKNVDTAALRAKIEKRKADLEANRSKEVYERMYFYGPLEEEYMLPIFSRQETEQSPEGCLKGVAGGGKAVIGRVKYVDHPTDADVEGTILMARRTDPGWTVLFPMVKAIIIERGSVLSHSAVIAREMGIPLVVGIRGLTDRVKDGMLVKVDGIKGTVEILEEEDESAR